MTPAEAAAARNAGVLVTIDSDTKRPGISVFANGLLLACGAPVLPNMEGLTAYDVDLTSPAVVAFELPEYRGQKSYSPDNLIRLAAAGALAAGLASRRRGCVTFGVLVSEWKSSVPKDLHQRRFMSALRPREIGAYEWARERYPKKSDSEIRDSIGIGLRLLGRTHKKGTPHVRGL